MSTKGALHKRHEDRGFEALRLGAYGLGSGCSVRLWVSSFQFRALGFEFERRKEALRS